MPNSERTLLVIIMKKVIGISLFVFAVFVGLASAQSDQLQPRPTPSRVIITSTLPPIQPARTPTPMQRPISTPLPKPVSTPVSYGDPVPNSQASNLNFKGLSLAQIKSKIAEAKRQMQTRPLTTDSVSSVSMPSLVRIAFYELREKKIDYIVISKDAFLTANLPTTAISTNGRQVTTRTIRANGVNTPVVIMDEKGQPQLPLLVQYPVERGGHFIETAYYMSTHPGLVTPEVVSAGRFYVRNIIDIARDNLRQKGYLIQPKVADIAERLANVEHVDSLRFRTEYAPNIFNDIYTLYALNEGQTFRYSVSTAGAGGMVQMIPSTYQMVRSRHATAGLMPDFVEGMRSHVNAAEAMLLYMQMTWNDLSTSPTIMNAMQTGIATQAQLMAAGYNSNPARLAGYINRGGANWTTLIPHETKIYLQVYDALEHAVSTQPRKQ